MNKNVIIGISAIAIVGLGYYLWKRSSENKSNAAGEQCNKNQTNKPCLEWKTGKGWTSVN